MSSERPDGDRRDESDTERSPTEVAAEALERLPSRRVASLYDLAVQYATLDWYQTVTGGEIGFDLNPEHLSLMTPDAKRELYDEPDNALVVNVDLTGETPQLADGDGIEERQAVEFRTVGRSQRYELGHAYPTNKTSSMTDYSLTTHKSASEHHLAGERDDAWGTANVVDRFTRWAHSEAADDVLAEYDGDTGVLEGLRELGDDEDHLREVATRAASPLDPDDEETDHELFVTVQIKTPSSDGYRYPGYFPVLNEVMAEQKRERLESMNVDSAGEGTGYVTGETGRVTGASGGLLGMYTKQQREHFPGVPKDGTTAWRARPVSLSTATTLATADGVFESFFTRLGEGRRLYVLPYLRGLPAELDPETVVTFVKEVFDNLRTADGGGAFEDAVDDLFVERRIETDDTSAAGDETGQTDGNTDRSDDDTDYAAMLGVDDRDDESVYDHVGITTALLVSGNPDRVFFQHLQTDTYRPRRFERARIKIAQELVQDRSFGDRPRKLRDGGFRLLGTKVQTAPVVFGSDFERTTAPTRSSHEVEGTPKAGDIDDVVTRLLDSFLGGDAVPRAELLTGFVHELVQTQRDQFGADGEYEVPDGRLLEQYVQFRALEAVGAVASDDSPDTISSWLHREAETDTARKRDATDTTHPTQVTQTESATNGETDGSTDDDHNRRAERLAAFVDDHPVLAESDPHRAAFLLGGLVGRISALQRRNDISSTLTRRYPVDYLTKQSIKEVTKEVLDANETYIQSMDKLSGQYNRRYVEPLPDLMLSAHPSDWRVTQGELQWVYALGIAYGKNDQSDRDDDEDTSDETDADGTESSNDTEDTTE